MKPNKNKTVLFVFSLSAAIEAERKPLFGSHKKNASRNFFKLLNQKTLNLAKKCNVDVVWLDETQQQGNSFGERYLNAYKSFFDQGYDKVISIGNDTPNLTVNHIQKAINALDRRKMVFGPSKDGGVYLLGYRKSAFNEKAFINFSWLTSNLTEEIKTFACKENLLFSSLEVLQDIDSRYSALEYAYSNLHSEIGFYIIFHCKLSIEIYQNTNVVNPILFSQHSFLLRGPPLLA